MIFWPQKYICLGGNSPHGTCRISLHKNHMQPVSWFSPLQICSKGSILQVFIYIFFKGISIHTVFEGAVTPQT